METSVQNEELNVPTDHFIKLQRLFDQEGPIELFARLMIEYECELSYIPMDTCFTNNLLSGGSSTGGNTGWLSTSYTPGLARRFWSWGIPDISTEGAHNRFNYSKLYQAATLREEEIKRTATKRASATDEDTSKKTKLLRTDSGSSTTVD